MIVLPIYVPVEVFNAIYTMFALGEEPELLEQLPPMFVSLLAYPIYTAGVIFYIASAVAGEAINTKTAWKLGIKYWAQLLLLSILVGISIMVGFLLLIIPGIILVARYAFSEFELLLNNRRPLDAMKCSWDASKNFIWTILGGYLVITIVLFGPYFGLVAIIGNEDFELGLFDNALNIIYSVLNSIYIIFAFRVYHLSKAQHNNGLNPTPESGAA